jgi:hypothetical protein
MTFLEVMTQFIIPERNTEIKREKWDEKEWWHLSSYKIYHLTKEDMEATDWEIRERRQ